MKMTMPVACLCFALALATVVPACRKQAPGEHFGEPFTGAPQVTIAKLIESPDSVRRQSVRVTGTIDRQCPSSGCWFFLRDGEGRSIRIELGDYLSTLPQRVGHVAEVEGEWIPKGSTHEFIGTRVTFGAKEAKR